MLEESGQVDMAILTAPTSHSHSALLNVNYAESLVKDGLGINLNHEVLNLNTWARYSLLHL
jgi:hypothetical protein